MPFAGLARLVSLNRKTFSEIVFLSSGSEFEKYAAEISYYSYAVVCKVYTPQQRSFTGKFGNI